ncbi:ATP-grasp domain-containing protein [Bacillus changyiensis]|uniref:ATP-grasp domain-containing protein n=1 Tax=Bacillus changyiensis TaxID=3004103 RepID=UPI0022DF1F75|nr:ATP-grasp domain-containing protein [Bacillus changyiensis]MDA1476595.1 ATP-grasp domain-containing protein [Bacillus changyiensis]
MNKNILVFPCGSEIGLEIHNSLRFAKNIKLFGASSVADHGRFVYKNYIENLPHIDDPNFLTRLNEIIAQYQIDFIFPAHDSVVLKLAQERNNLNAEIMTSSAETCEIARSKKRTYEFFSDQDFVPEMFESIDDVSEFPVFLKPDVGQGSKGIALARNKEELKFHLDQAKDLLILEYLPGKEYTIDCFTDKNGELKFVGKRERKRIKSGISVNSVTMPLDSSTKEIAHRINQKLEFRGAWFFQLKIDVNGQFKLLEIAPRIAGTMSLYRNKGVNFSLLSLYDRLGYKLDVSDNDFEVEVDRALINRFYLNYEYQRVYVDFDDTVTHYERVNPLLMQFLYQCVRDEKQLILITKHIHDIKATLKKLKISIELFDEIIHLSKDEKKSAFIDKDVPAIFIDDSFQERSDIGRLNIPVFDVDSVEALIDWRY